MTESGVPPHTLPHHDLPELTAEILRGGAEKYHAANDEEGQALRPRAGRAAGRRGVVRRGRPVRQRHGRRSARRRRGHRHRPDRRPAGVPDGQRLDREGRLLGRAHGREDHPDHRDARTAPACRWSIWWTPPARASPTRWTCSPAGAAPGKIFHTQVRASGAIPQVCALFGPVGGRRRVHPGVLRRRRSWSRATPRCTWAATAMVEMVTGEKTTLEEMGGARMHCAESGVGHFLVQDRAGRARDRPRATSPTCRRTGSRTPPSADGRGLAGERRPRRAGPGQRAAGVRHAPLHQGPGRRRTRSSRSTRCGPGS